VRNGSKPIVRASATANEVVVGELIAYLDAFDT
jgi:hypothetical protein